MNIIERLISDYPQGDVSPQDFIDHLSIGADGWIGAWVAVGLAVIFGMLVYIIPIYLTEKDKVGPYPLWLHTFQNIILGSSYPAASNFFFAASKLVRLAFSAQQSNSMSEIMYMSLGSSSCGRLFFTAVLSISSKTLLMSVLEHSL